MSPDFSQWWFYQSIISSLSTWTLWILSARAFGFAAWTRNPELHVALHLVPYCAISSKQNIVALLISNLSQYGSIHLLDPRKLFLRIYFSNDMFDFRVRIRGPLVEGGTRYCSGIFYLSTFHLVHILIDCLLVVHNHMGMSRHKPHLAYFHNKIHFHRLQYQLGADKTFVPHILVHLQTIYHFFRASKPDSCFTNNSMTNII